MITSPYRVSVSWLLANLIVATAYLGAASMSWVEPQLADFPGASGGSAFIWFLSAVPIFVIATLSNLGVLMWSFVVRLSRGTWPVMWVSWFIVLIWIATLLLDYSRHGA